MLALAATVLGSLTVALAGSALVGYVAHPLESWTWFVEVSAIPTLVTVLILARLAGRVKPTRARLLSAALFGAFFAVLLSGSFGAILIESLKRGLASVNVVGYIVWSAVYGVALLPITFPIGALVTRGLWGRRQLTTG